MLSFQGFPKGVLLALFLLTACDSAEERAAQHYQTALTLIAEADINRALVELRNAMSLDPLHMDARLAYADLQRDRGEIADAFGQYLATAEQFPRNIASRIALAEIAIASENWEDAALHGREAALLDPESFDIRVIITLLDYRAAKLSQDSASIDVQVKIANDILAHAPANLTAQKIIIDHAIESGDVTAALAMLDRALTADPDQLELRFVRLNTLRNIGDNGSIQSELEDMARIFPEQRNIQQLLVSWYMTHDNVATAEQFLRGKSDGPDAQFNEKLAIIEFVKATRGTMAAENELDSLLQTDLENNLLKSIKAGFLFERQQTDAAIAMMQAIIEKSAASDELRDIKVILAQMLLELNRDVETADIVNDILAEDAGHIPALKIKARQQMSDDNIEDAIITLRSALSQDPRDAEIITLLGDAHILNGDIDLAGDRYAHAVKVSAQAPDETQQYGSFLLDQGRIDAAETLLIAGINRSPRNVPLLAMMADIQIRKGDKTRAGQIVARLEALNTPAAQQMAKSIISRLRQSNPQLDELARFLDNNVFNDPDNNEKLKEIRIFLDQKLIETPQDPTLQFLRANIHTLSGETGEAQLIYEKLIADDSQNYQALTGLYRLQIANENIEIAGEILNHSIMQDPDAFIPNMLLAAHFENQGDVIKAIEIYQTLYSAGYNNITVANNLASLLATHNPNSDAIARASTIAAPLANSDFPPFQDTFGWLAYLRGEFEIALRYMQSAATGLPDDYTIQYRLGLIFIALERHDDARRSLQNSLSLIETTDIMEAEKIQQTLSALP